MKITSTLCLSALLLSLAGAPDARAEDWPRFRGPTGQGISADPSPPVKWSARENVVWRTPIPGVGWSSPIVWGDRVFLTSATENGAACHVVCVARGDGKILWDAEVLRQKPTRKEGKNSYATPTPVTDGKAVYASFAGGAVAVSFDGKVLWANQEFPYYSRHGLGASPALHGDLVILPNDGSNPVPDGGGKPPPEEYLGWQKPWDKAFVVALDKYTGKVRWKQSRELMTRISHVSPLVIDVGGEAQLISPAGDYVQALNPETGKPLWWVNSDGETPVPSVIYGDGLLFTVSGWPNQTIRAIRPGTKDERGDLTKSHIVWEDKKVVPTVPSFLFVDKPEPLLFAVKENGIAVCREPKTGKVIWQERLEGTYGASPVWAAGKIYLLNEAGKTTVIEASREFKVVAENDLAEPCDASPALSAGQLFIRTDKDLVCIGAKVALN